MEVSDERRPEGPGLETTLVDYVERRRSPGATSKRRALPAGRRLPSFGSLLAELERESRAAARTARQARSTPADLAAALHAALLVEVLRIVEVDTRDGDPATSLLRARVKRAVASALSEAG